MITNYSAGDFLIRVKNASMAGNKVLVTPKTKFSLSLAKILQKMHYLEDFKVEGNNINLTLTFAHKKPLISDIKIISKPGLRIYKTAEEIASYRKPSSLIITTSKGLMTNKEASKANLGGEIIAEIL